MYAPVDRWGPSLYTAYNQNALLKIEIGGCKDSFTVGGGNRAVCVRAGRVLEEA
jgi:hypothetical protein